MNFVNFQCFWDDIGVIAQNIWDYLYELCGKDDFNAAVWGLNLMGFIVYWLLGGLFTLIDVTGKPEFLLKYKIQEKAEYPIKTSRLWKVIAQVILNQLVVIPFSAVMFRLLKLRGCGCGQFPTFQRLLFEFMIFTLVQETGFYYSHRLLHHPLVYKHIHKQHHSWTSPISITAIYCHPAEHLMSNMLPGYMGPLIMGSHIGVIWLWFAGMLFITINSHSGFHLPFFPSPEAHDFHHLKFNQNFGALGVLDRLHGTDSAFRASLAYHRHILMLTLVPPRQLYPEGFNKKKTKVSIKTNIVQTLISRFNLFLK